MASTPLTPLTVSPSPAPPSPPPPPHPLTPGGGGVKGAEAVRVAAARGGAGVSSIVVCRCWLKRLCAHKFVENVLWNTCVLTCVW